jgi:predicted ribonuclease YlaK
MKMAILPKAIFMFNKNPIKIPMTFCTEIENNHEIYTESQKSLNSQSYSEQKSSAGDITIPNFKLHYRAITIKTAKHWHKKDWKTNGSE